MAKSKAKLGVGSKIGYCLTSTGSFVYLAETQKITEPDLTADDVKVSNLDSDNEAHEYIPGFSEGGEGKIDINYFKTQKALLYAQYKILQYWQILYNDGSTLQWYGYLKHVGGEVPYGDRMSAVASFKVSGLPTYVAGA